MTNYDILKEYEAHQTSVPSYEEWQQLKEQINKCYLDAINRGTANTVKAVKEFGMPERIKELVEQNAQLKELLKECKQWFDWYHIDTGTGKEYIESWHKKGHEIHKQLNEALK